MENKPQLSEWKICKWIITSINLHTMKTLLTILLFSSINCTQVLASEITKEEKLVILEEVYSKVYTAMGINENRPTLELDTKRSRSVAYLKKNKDGSKTIAVEEKAFDLCLSLGDNAKNALAFLIAHELGHFRYDHHWGSEFASSFAIADIQEDIAEASQKLGELKFYETQADQMGGVYCYLAGYNIEGIGSLLLPMIYEAYNLPKESSRYPSLDQRIEISKQNDENMKKLIHVYEAGTYALIIGKYSEARKCLEHCLNNGFKSREVYNNIGVANFLEAAQLLGHKEVVYAYPIELDVEARVKTSSKGFATNIEQLLKDAADKFEQAIRFDPSYATAYVNKACIFSLSKQFEDAEYFAKKGLQIAKENAELTTVGNALCVLGITYHQMGESKDAETKLKLGKADYNNYLCGVNLELIGGKRIESIEWLKPTPTGLGETSDKTQKTDVKNETIDGVMDFLTDLEGEELNEIKLYKGSCYSLQLSNSTLINLTTQADEELFFQTCSKNYIGETEKGISIGTDAKKVISKYGIPTVALSTRSGMLYYYSQPNIIFFTVDNKVSHWTVYRLY